MPFIGCFTVPAYCDNPLCEGGPYSGSPTYREFVGTTRIDCVTQARAKGWTITKRKAYCPQCKPGNREKP